MVYSGEPFLIATKPFVPSAFLAFATAASHPPNFFLLDTLAFLLTILPPKPLIRSDFFSPPVVFSFFPLNTRTFLILPFAILLTFLAFFFFFGAFFAFFAFFSLAAGFFFAAFFFFALPIVVKSKSFRFTSEKPRRAGVLNESSANSSTSSSEPSKH